MTIEVLDPGPLSTLQDRGRRGWAHLGVARAGDLEVRATCEYAAAWMARHPEYDGLRAG